MIKTILFSICLIFPFSLVPTTSLAQQAGDAVYFKTTTYGKILRTIREKLASQSEDLFGADCRPAAESASSDPSYRCGEYPFGKIVNSSQKLIMNEGLRARDFAKNVKGARVTLRQDLELPIYLSRRQTPLTTEIASLTDRDVARVETTRHVGRDIFFKHQPADNALLTTACLLMPGARIHSPSRSVHLKAAKEVDLWLFSYTATYKMDAHFSAGEMEFDGAKVCGLFRTQLKDTRTDNPTPETELVNLEVPRVSGVRHEGFKVTHVHVSSGSFFTQILNFFSDVFLGEDIPEMIQKMVRSALQKELDEAVQVNIGEIKSGAWFERYMKSKFSSAVITRDLNKATRTALQQSLNAQPLVLRQNLRRYCLSTLKGITENFGVTVPRSVRDELCPEFNVTTKIEPFIRNAEMREKGCYSQFHAIYGDRYLLNREGLPVWWRKECAVISRITVSGLPNLHRDATDCLINQHLKGLNQNRIALRCSRKFLVEALNITPGQARQLVNLAAWRALLETNDRELDLPPDLKQAWTRSDLRLLWDRGEVGDAIADGQIFALIKSDGLQEIAGSSEWLLELDHRLALP